MARTENGVTYYTVRFLNYAGTDLIGSCEVEEGGNAAPLAPEPEVIEGMTFKGWNAPITNVMADMTVRPVYEGTVALFTVNFLNYAGQTIYLLKKWNGEPMQWLLSRK